MPINILLEIDRGVTPFSNQIPHEFLYSFVPTPHKALRGRLDKNQKIKRRKHSVLAAGAAGRRKNFKAAKHHQITLNTPTFLRVMSGPRFIPVLFVIFSREY
ncbi:MAG: hypothetical protein JJU13_00790 [Balneolaceae bacterium]|nr:hypothetical protein [Balneolaceae bacterium]